MTADKGNGFVTRSITIDFHNTIAQCDEWFDLEVFNLIPAFLRWCRRELGYDIGHELESLGKCRYRALRAEVMDTGIECDAETSVDRVLAEIGMPISRTDIREGLEAIFRPTVESTTPMPGAVETIQSMREAGLQLAVVSSAAYHPFLEWTLDRFGILDCFSDIFTSASTGHYKSRTRIYEVATARLGTPPGNAIHIGDSEQFDVRPAASIGMRTVLLLGDEPSRTNSIADIQIRSFSELFAVLESRFGVFS